MLEGLSGYIFILVEIPSFGKFFDSRYIDDPVVQVSVECGHIL